MTTTFALLLFASATPAATFPDVSLTPNTKIHFATVEEGKAILMASDDAFLRRLSPFDRSSRMMLNRPVSQAEYLKFVQLHVQSWTEKEVKTLTAIVQEIGEQVSKFNIDLPTQISLVKTTGGEEAGAAYTLGKSIVLPARKVSNPKSLTRLFAHELAHVLSREDESLREQLYAMIGFRRCPEVKLPASLRPLRLTNPDAPAINHTMIVTYENQALEVATVLYASRPYDGEATKLPFFRYLKYPLMAVKRDAAGIPQPLMKDGQPLMLKRDEVVGFYEQVGRNTGYTIHPEEILADNFADIVVGREKWASPEIPMKMKAILLRSK